MVIEQATDGVQPRQVHHDFRLYTPRTPETQNLPRGRIHACRRRHALQLLAQPECHGALGPPCACRDRHAHRQFV